MTVELKSSVNSPPAVGYSLTEVVVAAALIGLLFLGFAPVFNMARRAMVGNEAKTALKSISESVMTRIDGNLREARRVYVRRITSWPANTAATVVDDFSAYVDLTGCPPPLSGSQMHTRASTETVGNVLFFVKQLPPLQVVTGSTTTAVGVLVFYYYYVSLAPGGKSFGNGRERHLYEWKSVPYLEWGQLTRIGDAGLRSAVIEALRLQGGWRAYDVSQPLLDSAFYNLTGGGTLTLNPGHLIQRGEIAPLTTGINGRSLSGFSISVSPNTAVLPTGTFKYTVPTTTFGTNWTGDSPSGFEVTNNGQNKSRGATLLRVRLVLLAQGPFDPFITREGVIASTVQDVW